MVLTHYLAKIGAFLVIGAGIAAGFLGSIPFLKRKHASNPSASGERRVVCVIGGGFGGLYSALYISLRCWSSADVYLIDPKKHFTMTPLLYELAVGTAQELEVTPCYKDLLTASTLKHMCGTVVSVDIPQQQCTILLTDSNDEPTQQVVRFDELVIAAGIQPGIDFVQGAKEHALPFYSANDAFALKRKLKQLKTEVIGDINIVVIGGGYGGVEVAANISENLCGYKSSVTIVDRNAQLMAASSDFNRNTAERCAPFLTSDFTLNDSLRQWRQYYIIYTFRSFFMICVALFYQQSPAATRCESALQHIREPGHLHLGRAHRPEHQ